MNEVLVVGVQIQVKKNCTLPARYKGMFHGQTNIKRGTYMYWFPVKNVSYARMVHEVERWYKRYITIKYGVAGTMEM
ncbi:MAG: hypothetical protein IKS93_03705 [Methanobrevibacter sp.]|nr:hypothetical protein [Methanobrevibacter sp.]